MITKDIEGLGKEKNLLETDIAQKEADIKIKNGEIKSLQVSLLFFIVINSFLNMDTQGVCVLHATHTGRHKRMGTFEMCSGSERMHTWRRTPSTGRNFQTLIISWISSIFVGFFKSSRFFVSPCMSFWTLSGFSLGMTWNKFSSFLCWIVILVYLLLLYISEKFIAFCGCTE